MNQIINSGQSNQRGIRCPKCGYHPLQVKKTRPGPDCVKRRRDCPECGHRTFTVEKRLGH